MKRSLAIILLALAAGTAHARKTVSYNPLEAGVKVVFNQPLHKGDYARLPASAQKELRKDVWMLSRNSAGLTLKFRSDAPEIKVRYTVAGNLAMDHMPATGVSGLDLYAATEAGETMWCAAERKFGDTVTYNYKGLAYDPDSPAGRDYELYLPLYNTVRWMEIIVSEDSFMDFVPADNAPQPVVVYGTSIAQGACASRPGMAWTAILHRALDKDVVNLGFSGNGRLEPAVLDIMNSIDASLYILDCMPNMGERFEPDTTRQRIIEAVARIRGEHPDTPILLVEHAGYTNAASRPSRRESYITTNRASRAAFDFLKSEGDDNLHYLSCEEISMPEDGMVDGIHPTDYGMESIARAYENKIKSDIYENF